MKESGHIVITGFMAAGKTAVARALAQELNMSMTDLDKAISQRADHSIAEIIAQHGENYFRLLETSVLKETVGYRTSRVVALGGGTWTLERNRKLLARRKCATVWLDVPFELCWQRIEDAHQFERPLANDYGPTERLYHERRSLYQLAMIRIAVDQRKSVRELAFEIAHHLKVNVHRLDLAAVGLPL